MSAVVLILTNHDPPEVVMPDETLKTALRNPDGYIAPKSWWCNELCALSSRHCAGRMNGPITHLPQISLWYVWRRTYVWRRQYSRNWHRMTSTVKSLFSLKSTRNWFMSATKMIEVDKGIKNLTWFQVNHHIGGLVQESANAVELRLFKQPLDIITQHEILAPLYIHAWYNVLWLTQSCLVPWINHLPPVCWSTFGILVWNDSGYVNLTQWWYFFIIFEYILHISTPHITIFCFPLPYFPLSTSALFFA